MTRVPIPIDDAVQLSPVSTWDEPYRFNSLSDAVEFSVIIRRSFWATQRGDDLVYHIEPGVMPIPCRRRPPENLGTGSGTGREGDF